MKTTVELMLICVDAHMDCIGCNKPPIIFFTSSLMCAIAYDYIARGDY